MSEAKDKIVSMIPDMDDADKELHQRLLDIEITTVLAAIHLRADFKDENAKSIVVAKFFSRYEMTSPEGKLELKAKMDKQMLGYVTAWEFAGLYNFPYRDVIASMYLSSISGVSDEQLREHIKECQEIKIAITAFTKLESVV